jgi:hypothetical protein
MFFYRDMLMMLARKEGWMKQREFEIIWKERAFYLINIHLETLFEPIWIA